jgi:hypothetical protein
MFLKSMANHFGTRHFASSQLTVSYSVCCWRIVRNIVFSDSGIAGQDLGIARSRCMVSRSS